MNTNRYKLVQFKGIKAYFLVSKSSLSILEKLGSGAHYSYEELSEEIDMPKDSLYVFCQRLEQAGVLSREKLSAGTPKRIRTVIKLLKPFKELDLRVIR